jgi:hypothetical protein
VLQFCTQSILNFSSFFFSDLVSLSLLFSLHLLVGSRARLDQYWLPSHDACFSLGELDAKKKLGYKREQEKSLVYSNLRRQNFAHFLSFTSTYHCNGRRILSSLAFQLTTVLIFHHHLDDKAIVYARAARRLGRHEQDERGPQSEGVIYLEISTVVIPCDAAASVSFL